MPALVHGEACQVEGRPALPALVHGEPCQIEGRPALPALVHGEPCRVGEGGPYSLHCLHCLLFSHCPRCLCMHTVRGEGGRPALLDCPPASETDPDESAANVFVLLGALTEHAAARLASPPHKQAHKPPPHTPLPPSPRPPGTPSTATSTRCTPPTPPPASSTWRSAHYATSVWLPAPPAQRWSAASAWSRC